MDTALDLTRLLSLAAFLYFGSACLVSRRVAVEFERYGLARFRILTGLLELSGALGLALAPAHPVLLVPAAAGLSLLMLLGVATRLRIRDPLLAMLPALVLLLMNGFLVVQGLRSGATR